MFKKSIPAVKNDMRMLTSSAFVYAAFIFLTIVMLSWHDGIKTYLLSRAAFGSGHLAICASVHVHEGIDLADCVPLTTIRDALQPVKECRAVLPRLRFDATLTAGEKGVRAVGFGIDSALEKSYSPLARFLAQGSYPVQPNDIVITRTLARALAIEAGDHLNIITMTKNGEYAGRRMHVSGVAVVPLTGYDHAFFADISGCYSLLRTDAPQFAVIDCEKRDRETIQAVIRFHPLLANLHSHRPEDTGTLRTFKLISVICISICSAFVLIAFLFQYAAIVLRSSAGAVKQKKPGDFGSLFVSSIDPRIINAVKYGALSSTFPLAGCAIGAAAAFILMFAVFGSGISCGLIGRIFDVPQADVITPVLSPSMLMTVLFPLAAFTAGTAAALAKSHPGRRTPGKHQRRGT
ncbi:MAG: hypothetical protein AABZ39_02165 [Spirochaetota bacterium]